VGLARGAPRGSGVRLARTRSEPFEQAGEIRLAEVDTDHHALAVPARAHDPGPLERLDVARRAGLRQPDGERQVADTALALDQPQRDPEARGMAERGQEGMQFPVSFIHCMNMHNIPQSVAATENAVVLCRPSRQLPLHPGTDMDPALPILPGRDTIPSFYGLRRETLAKKLGRMGVPGYRADQLYSWVYQKQVRDPALMANLPAALRRDFASVFDMKLPGAPSILASADGDTHKVVLELHDGLRVESVSMRTPRRVTFCVSSQVGCALKCAFCATGLMGLKRNLRAEEIVAQVLVMGDLHQWRDDRFNIVFMGMGEPLANLEAVSEAIRILHDERGLNLGARRITVSTSGLVPQIRELAKLDLQVGLALSLHATTDELRDRLMPVNRRWPIAEVLDATREYGAAVGRRVTLEYTLIGGVNDTLDDADRLAAFARALPSKINIIPYNPVPGLEWKRPSQQVIDAFAERLYPRAPAVTVRNTMGGEIWAACGQLGGLSPSA